MTEFQPAKTIRNISIIAHVDAGKTTVSEQILFHTGKTHVVGSVDDGSAVLDYLEEERSRGITITSAVATVAWNEHYIHLIDTPGHIDFTCEVEKSLRVIDGAVVIFSAVEGVEAQSEKVWRQADKYNLPRVAFVNKMDREGAHYKRTLKDINDNLCSSIAVSCPIYVGNEFLGILDLINEEVLVDSDVDYTALMARKRLSMIARLAEFSDLVAEKYLSDLPVEKELIISELRRLTIACELVPVLCGSAKNDIGVTNVLDAIIDFIPDPSEKPVVAHFKNGEDRDVVCDETANFSALVFKIASFSTGNLVYLRTYSGILFRGMTVYNSRTKEKFKVNHILRLFADNQEHIERCGPGDIVAIICSKDTVIGDTLSECHKPFYLDRIEFPEPIISSAIEPASCRDKEQLLDSLQKICNEDPTIQQKYDEETGQLIISAMGELHLDIIKNRLENEFKLSIKMGAPMVAYREQIISPTVTEFEFNKELPDKSLWAKVAISVEHNFEQVKPSYKINIREQGIITKKVLRLIEDAVLYSLHSGGLNDYPLINASFTITDIELDEELNHHESVAPAIFMATNQLLQQAKTVVVEPVLDVEIICRTEKVGVVVGYLQSREAKITNINSEDGVEKISAVISSSKMFGLSREIPRLTAGRGSFTMNPSGYQKSL